MQLCTLFTATLGAAYYVLVTIGDDSGEGLSNQLLVYSEYDGAS